MAKRRPWLGPAGIAAAAAAVLALYLSHPIGAGYRLPIGPDGPVYTWLARYAEVAGFGDAPGGGPGVPALTLTLSRLLGTEVVDAVTLLGPVLATACGLAAAALLEAALGPNPVRAVAAVLLTGAFAAYLAGGWLANLSMVALFITALAALGVARRSWRAVAAGGALLAAAGLAHLVFLAIGLVILAGVMAAHLPEARADVVAGRSVADTFAARIASAGVGGAAAALAGFASLAGPALRPDTSQDGFFRRLGLRGLLFDRYRERFLGDLGRAAVPLAAGVGLGVASIEVRPRPSGPGARYLASAGATWAALTVVGLPLLAATGWGPPNRLLQFAFFLPVAAAVGIAALARAGWPWSAVGVAAGVAFVVVSIWGWVRQSPSFRPEQVAAVHTAGRAVAGLAPDTPVVFLVDTHEPAPAYHVTNAANVTRMGVAARQIDDVYIAVGSPDDLLAGRPTLTGDREHDAVSATYLREVTPVLDRAAVLVLRPFNAAGFERARELGDEVAPGVVLLQGPSPGARAEPAAPESTTGLGPGPLVGLSVAALAVLGVLGAGWARWALPGARTGAVAAPAPSVGIAAAILGPFAGDRVGIGPGGVGSLAVVLGLAAAGYLAALRAGRPPG